MKRFLITLRHPGPAQAIAAVLPALIERSIKVAIVATDTALVQMQDKFRKQIRFIELYYFKSGAWLLCQNDGRDISAKTEIGDPLEFDTPNESGYKDMVLKLSFLVKEYRPDIVLRTTPAIKWGVDEALVEACKKSGIDCSYRCYQEFYGCGMNLDLFPYDVATVDEYAAETLRQHGIKSVVTGWLNQAIFEEYRPYKEARYLTRRQLGLGSNDRAVLYCTVASGDLEAELAHFLKFISVTTHIRKYIRFHPRNQEWERGRYMDNIIDNNCICVDSLPFDGLLAFPDFMVSVASAINLDMLQYQVMAQLPELSGISVYTKGPITESIILAATGKKNLPTAYCIGSLIVSEDTYAEAFENNIEFTKERLYNFVKKSFGIPIKENIKKFLQYLGI